MLKPRSLEIRPTSDRVKESIFDILGREIEGKTVLDLFAGTGNLGIEAISRGAAKVIFVEKGRQALRLIERNIRQFGLEDQCEIIPKDIHRALGILKKRKESFDVILMDPPYEKGWVKKTLIKLNSHPIYCDDALLVIEHSRREPFPHSIEGWNLIRQQRIGDTLISFLNPCRELSSTEVKITS